MRLLGHAPQPVREAIRGLPSDEILAIGIGCTNGLVAVDRAGKPLRPAIMLWDQRALPEVDYYSAQTMTAIPIKILGNFLAVAMSVESVTSARSCAATTASRSVFCW